MAQCQAKAKRTGKLCRMAAIRGKDKCRVHGGMTPIKHGLYSRYPDAIARIVAPELEEARMLGATKTLENTIPLVAAIISVWVAQGRAFLTSEAPATAAMIQRLTKLVEVYEKLTNPELRNRKLRVTHSIEEKSDAELVDEMQKLIAEAERICRVSA